MRKKFYSYNLTFLVKIWPEKIFLRIFLQQNHLCEKSYIFRACFIVSKPCLQKSPKFYCKEFDKHHWQSLELLLLSYLTRYKGNSCQGIFEGDYVYSRPCDFAWDYWKDFLIQLIATHTIFFRGYYNKKMGTLQLHNPGFQNDPSYPKQKDFFKSYEGKLK